MKIRLCTILAALAAFSAPSRDALAQSNPPSAAAVDERPAPEFAVSTDGDGIRFEVHAAAAVEALRVSIFDQDHALVFDSGTVAGPSFLWDLKSRAGERVAEGSYQTSIAARDSSGEIEQQDGVIAVPAADESAAEVTPNTSGSGTIGKIPKWTAAGGVLGDSIMTELNQRIGINAPNPAATLQLAGPQPATSAGAGVDAAPFLSMSGGKGGATSGSNKAAGRGAPVNITAGNGGNAPAGGKNGIGGNVVIKPGAPGTGGAAGASGKVVLAPDHGKVGVGTFLPTSKLTVVGPIESQNTPNTQDGGVKYPDGTVQRTAKAPDAEKLDGIDSSGYVKRATAGSGAISLSSVAANSCVDVQLSIGGLQPNDRIFFGIKPGGTLPAGLTLTVLDIPAAGLVKVRFCNGTNTASPASNDIGVVWYALRPSDETSDSRAGDALENQAPVLAAPR